jgi:D-sedoheptulose 7-phosphate isomerase/D-glycero-D-manno-heptose 1,7-bisphosphate phosphatase
MSEPGVLLDRDGTVIVDHGYVGSTDRVELIDGAAEAIGALNRAGIPVAVVTNQAGVARGYYGLADVRKVHRHIDELLAAAGAHIDHWAFCPYHPDGVVEDFARASADRKPGPGMGLAAAEALDLDLGASWVVGDRDTDLGLARALGARAIYVGPAPAPDPGFPAVPDLRAAVDHILAADRSPAALVPAPRFPSTAYGSADLFGRDYLDELARASATIDLAQVATAAKLLTDAYERDAAVFVCGNGGSASIANHMQCDHVKGVGNGTDLTTRVYSLSTNVELFSAIANDHGYAEVFEYQLRSQAREGDLLVVVSSSGRSPNIVKALEWAAANGLASIALTGFDGAPARTLATVSLHVDSSNYGIIEDAHQTCMHLLAQYVRQSRMATDTVATTVF